MFDLKTIFKLFKTFSKNEYLMRNLITPDKGEFSQKDLFILNKPDDIEEY